MMRRSMPGWSWEEDFDVSQQARLGRRIVTELDARLGVVLGSRLHAATGHPGLSRHLEKALDEVAGGIRASWKVARLGRPHACVTPDAGLFVRILPVLFEFGPPEISVMAIAGAPGAVPGDMGDVITEAVERFDGASPGIVRMDFDSGDLLRIV